MQTKNEMIQDVQAKEIKRLTDALKDIEHAMTSYGKKDDPMVDEIGTIIEEVLE